jgi:hypothetical protein
MVVWPLADNHMLKLERILYRCLRIALGLMQSTHVQTVEIIAGAEPLRLRYSMLNQRFLTKVLSSASHPLRKKLSELHSMGSPKIIREFSIISSLNINPRRLIYNYHLDALLHTPVVNAEVREALKDIQR